MEIGNDRHDHQPRHHHGAPRHCGQRRGTLRRLARPRQRPGVHDPGRLHPLQRHHRPAGRRCLRDHDARRHEGSRAPGHLPGHRAPRRLVFTWISEHTGHQESLVTVEFKAGKGSTEIVITHTQLPEATAAAHVGGWTDILDRLSKRAGDQPWRARGSERAAGAAVQIDVFRWVARRSAPLTPTSSSMYDEDRDANRQRQGEALGARAGHRSRGTGRER